MSKSTIDQFSVCNNIFQFGGSDFVMKDLENSAPIIPDPSTEVIASDLQVQFQIKSWEAPLQLLSPLKEYVLRCRRA